MTEGTVEQVIAGKAQWCVVEGDCLEVLPRLPEGCVHWCITDPPYGCGKADFDTRFPTDWYGQARRACGGVVIVTWSFGLKDSIPLAGQDLVGVIAAQNLNGMTFGSLGFGNWLAAVVACRKPRAGQDFFSFSVRGDMPDHPTPKPIEYMLKLIERVTEPGQTVLDCFCGSGSTGEACLRLGRRFIGIEIDRHWCEVSRRRLRDVLVLPFEEPAKPAQLELVGT